jgi:hypothetical protein
MDRPTGDRGIGMLDHVRDVKFTSGRGDDYIYTAGDINGHNVIIAT